MRHSILLLTVALAIIMMGCSGGGSPISPGTDEQVQLPAEKSAAMENHHLWGVYDVAFSQPSSEFKFAASKQSMMHVGVDQLTGGSPVGDYVTIDFRGIDKDKRILTFDLTLTNPFPNISARDVRGIISGNHPGYYLLNADGATEIFNDSPKTFVAFAKDEPNRIFGGGASMTETCELHFPPGADFSTLKLVIDASYPGNCLEPYAFSEFSFDGKTIEIGVLDWQNDVEGVAILSSAIGGDEDIALEYDEINGTWRATISGSPDGGYSLVNAEFIGRLASDSSERLADIITGFASTTNDINLPENQMGLNNNIPVPNFGGGLTSVSESGDTIKRLCFIKADSSGSPLYGLLRLEIEPLPEDLINEIAGVLKMSPGLQEQFYDPGLRDDDISIVVFIADTPLDIYANIKNDADAAFPEINELAEEIKTRYRAAQPEISAFADKYYEEFKANEDWAVGEYNAILDRHNAGPGDIGPLVRRIETLKERRASYVTSLLESNIPPLQEQAIFDVNGIEDTEIIKRDYVVNLLFLQTKVKRLGEIALLDSIRYIEPNYELAMTMNIAHQAVNAPAMWGAGYTGGTFDVMVFDTGIDALHPALAAQLDPSQIRAFTGCDPDDSHGHGTHCGGIVASLDLTYPGTGFGLDKLYNAKYCGGGWNEVESAHDWAGMGGTVIDPAEVTSFSWAWGPVTGCIRDASYGPARYVDETTYMYGQLWSIAAGNSSTGICADDNMITPPSDAYNSFCVANMNDFNTAPRANDTIAGSSRLGFAVAPGGEIRIKPDITAPGSSILSCNNDWEGANPDFVAMTGTSMAAPNVAGSSALVMDAGLTSSLEARAMILNSAEDWNSNMAGPGSDGPDIYTGYGYMDLNNALLNLGNIVADNIAQGDYRFYRHSSPAVNDSVMVIWDRYSSGWTDLYADIDIEMWDDTTNVMIGSEDKSYDTRRFLYTGTTNDVVYKIDANSIPAVSPTWDYVITATGGTLSTEMIPGPIDPLLGYVEPMPVAVEVDITATIINTGDFTLRDMQATLTLDTDMTFESGSMPTELGDPILIPTETTIITWHVKLNAPSLAPKHITVDTNAHAYGEIFNGQAEADIIVTPPDPELFVSPTNLNFGMATTAMPFYIQNIGGGTLNWTIDDSLFPAWLNIDKIADFTQDETDVVLVGVDRDGFTPSTYTHDIDVISDAGNSVVHISMIVPDPEVPALNVHEENLYFGEVVLQKNITITNAGGGALHWQIDHEPPNEFPGWLSVNIDEGIVDEMHPQGGVIVYCDRAGYAPGNYNYDMHFTSDGGDAIVHIYMAVHVPVPDLYVSDDELDFGTDLKHLEFIVQNVGEDGSTLNWSIPIGGIPAWLSLSMFSGNIGTDEVSTVHVYVDRSGLTNPGGYSHLLQLTSNAGNFPILAKLTLPDIDPLAPVQIAPMDGHTYEVCTYLALAWAGNPGYDGNFWMDSKYNGVAYPAFSDLAIPGNSLNLPQVLVDKLCRYGIWDWQVSIIETPVPMTKHYSGWWTIYKQRPALLTPTDGAVVSETTQFTWDKVPTSSPGSTIYVAKVKGFAPIDPFYFWWTDADTAVLPPNWYQLLQNLGQSNTYTWTIAAVCRPAGGMTLDYAEVVKYPPAWTFHLE